MVTGLIQFICNMKKKSPSTIVKKSRLNKRGFLAILSRHPSVKEIRNNIKLSFRAIYRHGSKTVSRALVQINSIESIINASDKLTMKKLFKEAGVISPNFLIPNANSKYEHKSEKVVVIDGTEFKYPIICKLKHRSRGQGMKKINNFEELKKFHDLNVVKRKKTNVYYYEQFINYTREYRIHVSVLGGCVYTCRKMIRKEDLGKDDSWFRNNSNCIWYVETNKNFNKPSNWDEIVKGCVQSLNAVGLDIGACDVKIAKDGRYSIIEINSAPSIADGTAVAYSNELEKIAKWKKNNL